MLWLASQHESNPVVRQHALRTINRIVLMVLISAGRTLTVKLLRQIRQRLFAHRDRQRDLGLKCRTVVPAWSLAQRVPVRDHIGRPGETLVITLFSFSEPI
jgi:hypothetical protein